MISLGVSPVWSLSAIFRAGPKGLRRLHNWGEGGGVPVFRSGFGQMGGALEPQRVVR